MGHRAWQSSDDDTEEGRENGEGLDSPRRASLPRPTDKGKDILVEDDSEEEQDVESEEEAEDSEVSPSHVLLTRSRGIVSCQLPQRSERSGALTYH